MSQRSSPPQAAYPPRFPRAARTRDPILGLDVHPDCAAAVVRTGRLLEGLGHRVEEDHPRALTHLLHPIADDLAAMVALTRASQAAWLARQLGRVLRDGDLEPGTLTQLRAGPAPTRQRAAQAAEHVREAAARPLCWWDDHDILVTPVMRQPPWPLGEHPGIQHAGAFCFPSSLSGQPALSLPLASTHDGIPVGVQLVARRGADEHLLALAADLEAQAPWPTVWLPARSDAPRGPTTTAA
ncbi:amidase family protein [Frankia sp. R82]|uniref:amidase family protein n=1 Tax=Frankia sp. R82 TaxID=2950553 RepID=UPI002043D42E|nr:amidase family protein [Frankia sp. R82]MCM3884577.1 amidase [Frankia sp. R82]